MKRDEALKKMQAVKSYMTSGNPIWSVTEIGEAFDMAIEALEAAEQKTGKWIRMPMACYGGGTITEYECSECSEHQMIESKWCPNCGARMVQEGEDNDG